MTSELLDISDRLDAGTVATYRDFAEVAASLAIDYLVVGASGRDLILSYGYGLQVQRATNDYDFAFEIGDLSKYEDLKAALLKKGFTQSRESQRLASSRGVDVDLVPFGQFADEHGNITLPGSHVPAGPACCRTSRLTLFHLEKSSRYHGTPRSPRY